MGGSGHGDRLARGSVRAQFGSNSQVDQDKWNAMFEGWEGPEAFVKQAEALEQEARDRKASKQANEEEAYEQEQRERDRNPNVRSTGDVSVDAGETR